MKPNLYFTQEALRIMITLLWFNPRLGQLSNYFSDLRIHNLLLIKCCGNSSSESSCIKGGPLDLFLSSFSGGGGGGGGVLWKISPAQEFFSPLINKADNFFSSRKALHDMV